jgi:hypothetical protein
MSIRSKLAVVSVAEADCALRRANISAAWRGFKQESERAATPGRVVGAGLIAGFLSGLGGGGSKGAGSALGGKLFGMLLENALAGVSGALAAGAAAAGSAAHDEPAAGLPPTAGRD